MPVSCESKKDNPPTILPRFCCMLSSFHPILEPVNVLSYIWGDPNKGGLMYTCNAGFLDFGHLFDFAEITYYYYHYLTKGGRNTPGKTIPGFLGEKVTIKSNIAATDRPTAAASMAFDFSVFYEIMTYWQSGAGQHNSSFSPEDLVSNYIGARIAERAIRVPGARFDLAVRAELKALLPLLQPRTVFETQAALEAIDGLWVKNASGGFLGLAFEDEDFLLHRNVNRAPIKPCYVTGPGIGCAGTPSLPSQLGDSFPDSIRNTYDAEYVVDRSEAKTRLGSKVSKADFTRLIADVKADPRVGVLCPP